jgi:hypothetical protein
MSVFTIEELPEDTQAGLAARFRLLPPAAPPDPSPAELALAAALNGLADRISAADAREHPRREEWLRMLRNVASASLLSPKRTAADLAEASERVERARKTIHFTLERFAEAPFRISHKPGTTEIDVGRRHGTAPPSADQEAFLDEFQQAESFLTSLYRPSMGIVPPRREEETVWVRLASAAELALADARPSLAVARGALRAIMRDAIRDRAPAYRQAYLRRLWQSYVVALFATAALLLLYNWFAHHERHLAETCVPWIGTRCWQLPEAMRVTADRMIFFATALASLAFGAWLSACARLDTNSPEVLTAMLSETNPTLARAVMVLGFGAVALILLDAKLVVVQIGDDASKVFDSKVVLEQLHACLLIGVFLGLGERALPGVINQRATAFVAGLGGAGAPAPR